MKVEVFGIQVGEDRAIKHAAVNAVSRQRMGADLEDRDLNAFISHPRELVLNDRCWGRGMRGPISLARVADGHRHGRDQSSADSGRAQDGRDQVCSRRLPIGPGHSDKPNLVRRMTVQRAGKIGKGESSIGNQNQRNGKRRWAGRLTDNRGRASLDRLANESSTIRLLAGTGDEHRAGRDRPAIR